MVNLYDKVFSENTVCHLLHKSFLIYNVFWDQSLLQKSDSGVKGAEAYIGRLQVRGEALYKVSRFSGSLI